MPHGATDTVSIAPFFVPCMKAAETGPSVWLGRLGRLSVKDAIFASNNRVGSAAHMAPVMALTGAAMRPLNATEHSEVNRHLTITDHKRPSHPAATANN